MTKNVNKPHKQIPEYGVGDLPAEQSENLQPKITEKNLNDDSLNSSIQLPNSSGIKETDFSKYRLSQDFLSQVGVKKVLSTVPVRKPSKQEFVRVHPHEEWRLETLLVELKDERENYLIAPEFHEELSEFATPTSLLTTISRQKVLMLWPTKLPGLDGQSNPWHVSALQAAKLAEEKWVRVSANMSLGGYEVFEALGNLSDPEWPDDGINFGRLLEIAFRGRIINSLDHPIVKKLRGLA
jgi:hypothetical protein